MTKEQAIEILTKKVDSWKCKRPRNPIIFNGLINEIDTENNAIETVLSMLKHNSAEIEKKNTELAEKNSEIEKKDKIIYEMIGSFIDLGFGFEYCNNDDRCINNCEECLMKYFERKATNNG